MTSRSLSICRVCSHYADGGGGSESVSIAGAHTEPVSFKTLPCEPDKPQTPKQSQKSKTSLSLKWNVSTVCWTDVAPPALTSRVLVGG